MRPTVKYWIFLLIILGAVFGVILGSLAAAWQQISLEEQAFIARIAHRLIPFPLIGATFLFLILGGLVSLLFYFYVVPILRLSEETKLISAVNPSHRIQPKGAPELVNLAGIINESADAFETLQAEIKQKINQARSDLHQERNLLAALMSELPTGVLAVNAGGQILLYNQQAQKLLQKPGKFIGLGRSLFGILDRGPIVHAIDMLHQAVGQGQKSPTANFVMTVSEALILRVHMAPVFKSGDGRQDISGFVLAMEDLSRQMESGLQQDQIFQGLTTVLRASLRQIRQALDDAAAPEMVALQAALQSIDRTTSRLSNQLEQSEQAYRRQMIDIAHTENVLGDQLLNIVERHLRRQEGLELSHRIDEVLWLQVDSYAMVQGLGQLVNTLRSVNTFSALSLELKRTSNQRALLTISWPGCTLDRQQLSAWQNQPLIRDTQDRLVSFSELIERIGGILEEPPETAQNIERLAIRLPLAEPEEHFAEPSEPSIAEHRPIHYEFGLLNQVCLDDICQNPLDQLSYAVFDTETTGLKPSQGDEIIQIGAVRMVNGRILYDETLDQLIDPRRPVPEESVRIHGIAPELLLGQPTIQEALPVLHQFAEGSVLVAHNAAFDMKFLKLKEQACGVRFDQPVLDTLLLSWFVHPHQQSHSLEEVAKRLGIAIVGRHTALGDALVTAEIFCKLIPLLTAKGVHTLSEAMEASSKAPFAHLDFY